MGSHFGVGVPPILELILVWIGMFTGGTIWFLTHGHLSSVLEIGHYIPAHASDVSPDMEPGFSFPMDQPVNHMAKE